jgi:hypothetical protein
MHISSFYTYIFHKNQQNIINFNFQVHCIRSMYLRNTTNREKFIFYEYLKQRSRLYTLFFRCEEKQQKFITFFLNEQQYKTAIEARRKQKKN